MSRWRRCFSWVLDWIYPGVCELCSEVVSEGRCLCDSCAAGIPGLKAPFCQICGEGFDGPLEGEFSCPNCRDLTFAFDFARPALVRSDDALKLIGGLKYQRHLHLARDLADLARRAFEDPRLREALENRWPLVPVPLHRRRFYWRQFNQAREIALPLGRELGLPVQDLLKRVRPTPTQTRLTRSERQKNLKGAFIAQPNKLPGAILIDDVFTTGSTAHECAKVLRRAGTQKVVVLTVMRG